jgi:hypothetical protein
MDPNSMLVDLVTNSDIRLCGKDDDSVQLVRLDV